MKARRTLTCEIATGLIWSYADIWTSQAWKATIEIHIPKTKNEIMLIVTKNFWNRSSTIRKDDIC